MQGQSMFGLMKQFLKDKITPPGAVRLADIHVGCMVGFGFMPQKNLSGRRLAVKEINSYLFEDDSFVSFRLDAGSADVSVIVAEGEGAAGTYLALSRRIEERLVSPLFSSCHPRGWFALKEGDRVTVNRDVLGVPAGWLVNRYRLVMSTKGKLLEGDYRLRKPASYASVARPFDYVLLVDEANEFALEAELYEDGSCPVFSTVYRPATDIGEISHPQRLPPATVQRPTHLGDKIEHVPPALPITVAPAVAQVVEEAAPPPAADAQATAEKPAAAIHIVASQPPLRSKSGKDASVDIQEKTGAQLQPVAQAAGQAVPVHGKFGRIQPGAPDAAQPADMLACDIKLAGLIIEEAQRNRLVLSELIRKVIDLPARVQDQVFIPFALSDAEYGELARRYGLQASDHGGVMARILEELRQFAGGT